MAVHSGFLSYRNEEGSPAKGGSALHRGPCTSDIIGGVKTEKKKNRGCVNLYGKKMTTERGGHTSQKLR